MSDETIFSKIIRREIPAKIVYENEKVLAFRDINPAAPVHILIIPKRPVKDIMESDSEIFSDVFSAAQEIARQEKVDAEGFRLVVNNGASAGQSVFHLHVHLIAGRALHWPPG